MFDDVAKGFIDQVLQKTYHIAELSWVPILDVYNKWTPLGGGDLPVLFDARQS